MQKVKGCWELGPKWGIHVTPLLLGLGIFREEEENSCKSGSGVKESVLQTYRACVNSRRCDSLCKAYTSSSRRNLSFAWELLAFDSCSEREGQLSLVV